MQSAHDGFAPAGTASLAVKSFKLRTAVVLATQPTKT